VVRAWGGKKGSQAANDSPWGDKKGSQVVGVPSMKIRNTELIAILLILLAAWRQWGALLEINSKEVARSYYVHQNTESSVPATIVRLMQDAPADSWYVIDAEEGGPVVDAAKQFGLPCVVRELPNGDLRAEAVP